MNGRQPEIPPHKLISALRGYDLLPAIVFMPTRRKCDEAALEVAGDKSQKTEPNKFERRREIFEQLAAATPDIRSHKHAQILVNSGVASHHAGHVPSWKLAVEKMMSAGVLNAIFATSTVAAGVDFPARTVVIINADTRGNDGWRPLSANELHQMTGRAGRRGKDNVGFAVLAPGQFQDPKKIASLLRSPPDPLESKFRATYTTLLNLLDAFGSFELVRDIAEKSYAFVATARQIAELRNKRTGIETSIELSLASSGSQFTFSDALGFERLTSARRRLDENIPASRADLRHRWLTENVRQGRIVTQGRSGKRLFLVISVHGDSVSAMSDDGRGRNIPLSRVNRIYERTYGMNDAAIEQAFLDTIDGKNKPLPEPKLSFRSAASEPAELLDSLIAGFGSDPLLWQLARDAGSIEKIDRDISFLRSEIWQPFENRARVLDRLDYIEMAAESVTESGRWLADLRVDRPLLVGEAIRNGIFDELDTAAGAGLMAALAADSDRSYGELYLSNELLDVVAVLEDLIYEVSRIEWRFGVEPAEEINLSAAAAAELWSQGVSWNELVRRTRAEEGDLVRLLSRTGEALMQIAHLKSSNPRASSIARAAADVILRDPIR